MPNPYNDPYGIGQTLWRQGQQQTTDAPKPQGPTGYQINNQYYDPKNRQQFGSTTQQIGPGGAIGAPDPNAVASDLDKIMGRKSPTIAGADFSGMQNTQASQMGLLGKINGYAQGLGPSAAQVGNTMAMGQAANAARAGLAGNNPLAARAALGVQQSGLATGMDRGAQARSQEQAGAMNAYGGASNALAQHGLGASALGNQQIEQQQALALGQAQRNYGLAQGTLGTDLQEQMDLGKAGMQQYILNQQKQQFDQEQAMKYFGAAIPFVGGMITAGGTTATAAQSGGYAGDGGK